MSIDAVTPNERPIDKKVILPEVKGIFNVDILVRHALIIGLNDLRQNPWQLELVFASLLDDPYTENLYGAKERDKAISHFLKTEIPIIMEYNLLSSPNSPIITIGINEGSEAESTLSDTHYVPQESVDAEWEPVGIKFSGAYDYYTGVLTPSVSVKVNKRMVLIDGVGNLHNIIDITENNNTTQLLIGKGLVGDFNNCTLRWSKGKITANLGSCNFKETVNIGVHSKGDATILIWLFNIVKYSLMRYKKTLFEGRGFERTTLTYTKIVPNTSLAPIGSEVFFSRFITMTGYFKDYWAQETGEKITGIDTIIKASPDILNFNQIKFKGHDGRVMAEWGDSDGIGVSMAEWGDSDGIGVSTGGISGESCSSMGRHQVRRQLECPPSRYIPPSVGPVYGTKSFYHAVSEMWLDSATVHSDTFIGSSGQYTEGVSFPSTSVNGKALTVCLPSDYAGGPITVRPVWMPTTTSTGSVNWSIDVQDLIGSDITVTPTPILITGITGTKTIHVPLKETGAIISSGFTQVPSSPIRIGIYRNAPDAYAYSAVLMGFLVDYRASSIG